MIYRVFWFTIGRFVKLYWWVRPVGKENVPTGTGAILACNHVTALDPVLACVTNFRQVCWVAKVELVKTKRVAWFFRGAGVLPVDRNAPDEGWMRLGEVAYRKRKLIGIFPEGTRSPDGRIYKGYTGVARFAHRTGAPVVPTAVVGTRESHQKGRRLARPKRTTIIYGRPMAFDLRPGETEQEAYRRFTDSVLDEVAKLIDAERVPDVYSRDAARNAS
jgi:1-acyl-sn-glycerol-3-phosphate acyltransferase